MGEKGGGVIFDWTPQETGSLRRFVSVDYTNCGTNLTKTQYYRVPCVRGLFQRNSSGQQGSKTVSK